MLLQAEMKFIFMCGMYGRKQKMYTRFWLINKGRDQLGDLSL